MAVQIYKPLPPGDFIRLIEILPTKVSDILCLRTKVVELNSSPPYQAISYVWGDPADTKEILCDNHHLKITLSLFNALQRVIT